MQDLFINIDGLSSENLTTEILRHVLINDDFSIYQRVFYNYFIGINNTTSENEFDVSTQMRYTTYGIPDMLISNDREVYIIENKFYAPYSGDNQISRYINILNKHFQGIPVKKVFLLTIKNRREFYETEIKNDLTKNGLIAYLPLVEFRFWEDLQEIFKSNNFLIDNLGYYINKSFIQSIKFTKMNITSLSTPVTPASLKMLIELINLVKGKLNISGVKTGKTSQSINYYGFNCITTKFTLWFGYVFPLWPLEYEKGKITPVYIQLKSEWIKSITIDPNFETKIKGNGFRFDSEHEWIKPYDPELFINESALVKLLIDDINFIDHLL